MISRDPRCVYVGDHQHEVSLVVALLSEEGIDADAVNDATLGGLEGVVSIVPRAGIKGIEVWVKDLTQADAARTILAEHAAEVQAKQAARLSRSGSVTVVCPSCQLQSEFPASQQGTVQTCPSCRAYVDIPDPDEETEWPDDFGQPEDEA